MQKRVIKNAVHLVLAFGGAAGCGSLHALDGVGSGKKGGLEQKSSVSPEPSVSEQGASTGSAAKESSARRVSELTSAQRVGSLSVIPVAFLTWVGDQQSRSCMAGYLGEGLAVTAGHCLSDSPAKLGMIQSCEDRADVRWISKSDHEHSAESKKSSCLKAVSYFDGADPATDVAFLLLFAGEEAVLPSLKLVPVTEREDNPNVYVVGSLADSESQVTARVFKGYAFETLFDVFRHNTDHGPGMSGSPLFIDQGLPSAAAPWLAVGIHLGRGSGVNRALSAQVIGKYLSEAKSIFSAPNDTLESP